MSLRIAWAGPWDDVSPLATFGDKAVEELVRRGHSVSILRTETGSAARRRPRSTQLEVRGWNEIAPYDLLRSVDIVVVNFANDPLNCGAMLRHYQVLGTVGIFHDARLDRLTSCLIRTLANPRVAREAIGDPASWFAASLSGALVLKPADFVRVSDSCPGPVELVSIPKSDLTLTARACVESLLRILPVVFERRPTILASQALGRALASFGLEQTDPKVSEIGAQLDGLFAHE